MMTILLVSDHALFRDGIKAILENREGIQIAGESETCEAALAACGKLKPDIMLADSSLSDMEIQRLVSKLKAKNNGVKIIITCGGVSLEGIIRMLKAGVMGFLSKKTRGADLPAILELVAGGKKYIPPDMTDGVMSNLMSPQNRLSSLTDREYQIFIMLAQARKIREISGDLEISPRTVETHKTRIMRKLGLKNVVELVHVAIQEGVMNPN